jgi:hypothetical protein
MNAAPGTASIVMALTAVEADRTAAELLGGSMLRQG